MKTKITLISLLILCSCGKENGSSSSSPVNNTSPVSGQCHIKFSDQDDFQTIAIKANRMRIECSYTEEEVIAQLKR